MIITFEGLAEEAENLIQSACEEMVYVGHLPNIDQRAGCDFWVDDEKVITSLENQVKLDYYGGFEYIESEYRMVIGDYIIFSREHARVDEACGDIGLDEDEEEDEE